VGRNPGPIQRGVTLTQLTLPFDVPTGMPSDLLENRPDILQAEDLLIAANANIGQAVAQAFPSISLTGLYGNASLELRDLLTGFSRTWQIGTSLMQYIYTGGRITAQIKEADAQFLEALYFYEQTVLQAFGEVNDALIAHQKSIEIAQVLKHQVDVLERYLVLAKLQYENGQTDYLNVLDAERGLFAAELTYAESISNTFLSLVNLYKALGGGWVIAADLQVTQ
jgi:multidrug efflux system outer membrane protein